MSIDLSDSFETASLEDLESLARVISMEAFAANPINFDPKRRFSQFMGRAGAFFKRIQFTVISQIRVSPADINTFVSSRGFMEAANKEIIVPEGFVGQWLPYSADLKSGMGTATKAEYMVRTFNDTLGRLINDPEQLKALSGIGHQGPTTLGLDDAVRAMAKAYFDGKSNHMTRTLGAVVDRAADIPAVHNNVNDAVSLDKAHPAKKVLDAVERSMVLSESLIPLTETSGAVSKVALQEMIDITLQIAREMEAYGVLLFRIRQFSESLKDSVKQLKK